MLWEFPHKIEYEADARSVDEVVATLLAQKRLIQESALVLPVAFRGYELGAVEIRVVRVAEGSLITELIVQIYGQYQTDIQKAVIEGLEKMIGEDIPAELESLVTLLTLAVVYFIARYTYDLVRGKKKDQPASTHIEGNYNTVINIIGTKIGVSGEAVDAAIKDAIPLTRRRSLIKAVTGFLAPAKKNPGTKITADGYGDIPVEVIAEYPNDAELAEIDETRNIDVPGALIEIRALDRDKKKSGWAALVLNDPRFPRRLPMDLYPTVDAEELAHHDTVRGNLVVEGDPRPNGTFRPKRIHLLDFEGRDADDSSRGPEEGKD